MSEGTVEELRAEVTELRHETLLLRRRVDDLTGERPPAAPRTLPVIEAPPVASPASRLPRRPLPSVGELIDARVLAWLGGLATLIGLLLFLALATSHGWIDLPQRVGLAGGAAAALMLGGAWLHERRGQTEAAVAMVGTGTAGLLATLVVASEGYGLISPLVEVGGSIVVGAVATALAIRWAGEAIGALGLIGGLLSPMLVGAPSAGATVGVLFVATAAAIAVVVWRRWTWLAVAAVLASAGQWSLWLVSGHSTLVDILGLAAFASLGLAGAFATQWRATRSRLEPAAIALLTLNAAIGALIGVVALAASDAGAAITALWLATLAGAHVLPALGRRRTPPAFTELSCAVAVMLADLAFGLTAHGMVLVLGWSAAAIGCAWLVRRRDPSPAGSRLPRVGVAAHLGLVLVRVAVVAPPAALGADHSLQSLLAIATLAAALLACGQLSGPGHRAGRDALALAGLATIAYLTANVLHGPALVAAWSAEAIALCQLGRSAGDRLARIAGLAFVAGASTDATIALVPPVSLLTGTEQLLDGALTLGAVSVACLRVARTLDDRPGQRRWLLAGGAGTVLYLASVAVVSAFAQTSATSTSLDGLSIHQQGQVALSALWSVTGLLVLIAGLRLRWPRVRLAGLALLLICAAKVFLYDLSTLGSVERVISMIVLGLLLLAGAFAHQRLRPGQGWAR